MTNSISLPEHTAATASVISFSVKEYLPGRWQND